MENKVDIYTEVMTNDISDVQEHFNVDCAFYFSEAIKKAIMNNSIIQKKIGEKENNNIKFVKTGDKS